MKKTVCFGELMLRLNPKGYYRLLQADSFEVSFAGGEANVAVDLASLGSEADFVTKLPEHEVGKSAANALRKFGVAVSGIVYGGPRIGIYYVEKGASQRASRVIYDRAGSSISLAVPSDFDWDNIFKGAGWFHFTGITPALGGNLPEICLSACKKAKEMGLTVSCDLNYRKKLWGREEAGAVMERLMPYVDLCIANEEDAADIFGLQARNTDVNSGKLDKNGYIDVAGQIAERFGCGGVAITLRESISASRNIWSGMYYDGKDAFFSREYDIHIVDRVGGGDSFGAGLIYALQNHYKTQEAIEFAAAASCLKHTQEQDFNLVTREEVEALVKGNGSGRVQR